MRTDAGVEHVRIACARIVLRVDVGDDGPVEEYRRRLDPRTGVHSVSYLAGAVPVVREAVRHPGTDVLAVRVATGGGTVTISVDRFDDACCAVVADVEQDGPDAATARVAVDSVCGAVTAPLWTAAERVEHARRLGWHRFRAEAVALRRELASAW